VNEKINNSGRRALWPYEVNDFLPVAIQDQNGIKKPGTLLA
jgi:hypothetical protein